MDRKYKILKAIIESFIVSAEPVGSQYLLEKYDFEVSPATVRNEMAALEKLGYISQPYTSAGRVPTTKGFRMYVDELMEGLEPAIIEHKEMALSNVASALAEDRINQVVSLLARTSSNVSFATLPHLKKTYYLGLSNILQTPEFQRSMEAYTVVKVLEDSDRFIDVLAQLPIDETIRVFIGEENIISEIQSCSLITTTFNIAGLGEGIIGILGPKRMDYPHNIATLDAVKRELEG